MTRFFVPYGDPDDAEGAYAELARFADRPMERPSKRVASIDFVHESGFVWTAEVGATLRAERWVTRGRGSHAYEGREATTDEALVLAIFGGRSSYLVVTDARPLTQKESSWANPLDAGTPRGVVRFDPE